MFHQYDRWAQMTWQIHTVIKQYEVIITLPFILDKELICRQFKYFIAYLKAVQQLPRERQVTCLYKHGFFSLESWLHDSHDSDLRHRCSRGKDSAGMRMNHKEWHGSGRRCLCNSGEGNTAERRRLWAQLFRKAQVSLRYTGIRNGSGTLSCVVRA